MKKINLILSTLSIATLVSCGKSTGGYHTTTTSSKTDTETTVHVHQYNNAGLCSCGDYLGRELTYREAYGDTNPIFDVKSQNKVYFTWKALCKTAFIIDECNSNSVKSITPDSEFLPLFTSIEVYKEGYYVTNVLDDLELTKKVDDDGDEKYYYYETNGKLEADTTYYCVVTLAKEMEHIEMYTLVIQPHDPDYNWVINDEGTERVSTSVCPYCNEPITYIEEAILEIYVPLIKFESGKSFRENLNRIGSIKCSDNCMLDLHSVKDYNLELLVDSHITYQVYGYLYAKEGYFFPENFILRDFLGNPLSSYTVSNNGYNVSVLISVSCN